METPEKIPNNQRKEFIEFLQSLGPDFRETLATAIDHEAFYILDSLGISAGKVRERGKFLLDTTLMTRKQAFFQAAIEQVQKLNANT